MQVDSVGSASVYDFEILSDIHSTIKRSCPTGKQKLTISDKYHYHIPTKSQAFYL